MKVEENRPWADANNRAIADAAIVMAHRVRAPLRAPARSPEKFGARRLNAR
jgi:hypothetical protein